MKTGVPAVGTTLAVDADVVVVDDVDAITVDVIVGAWLRTITGGNDSDLAAVGRPNSGPLIGISCCSG